MQKQSVNKIEDSVDKVAGDDFSKAKNKDNRTVQDFRKITFFSVADGAYDSGIFMFFAGNSEVAVTKVEKRLLIDRTTKIQIV